MRAWGDGWLRVLAAPAVLGGVFLVTLLAALPLALTLRTAIEAHLGSSLAAAAAADGVNPDWWQEFASQATGLGTAFTPTILGFAATLDALSLVLDARADLILPVTAALAVYLAAWLFLSGAVIDRYARQRRTRAYGFFAAAGVYLWRFLRLAVLAGLAYWFLFAYVHGWLFDDLYDRMTRDVDVERTAFLWRAGLYAAFAALLAAVNLVFDYAKIRIVVEDRRSALAALPAAVRFVTRNARATIGLYALNALVFLLVLAVWAWIAPGAGGAGLSIWLGLLGSQCYVLARLAMKLQFIASQTALFQGRLAHAAYTAAPEPVWPESAEAEAIGPRAPDSGLEGRPALRSP